MFRNTKHFLFGDHNHNADESTQEIDQEYNNFNADVAKKEYIQKYGIELQMPATYIFAAFIYKPDTNFIISACCQILPKDVEFYDYNKLLSNEDPLDYEYIEQQKFLNEKLMLKVYSKEAGKFQEKKMKRVCDDAYFNKVCFSSDNRKMALFRKIESDSNINSMHRKGHQYVIDIFDCSSISFFLQNETLTADDPNLIATIKDIELGNLKKVEDIFARFSQNGQQLYLIIDKKKIMVFDVSHIHQEIRKHLVSIKLPHQYQEILEIGVNTHDLRESLIAIKKSEFLNIDIVKLGFLMEIQQKMESEQKQYLSNKEFLAIQKVVPFFFTIKLTVYDQRHTYIKFSQDHSQCIYCDPEQNIIVYFFPADQQGHKQRQINHLQGKQCRALQRYEESDFMIATADAQDNEISLRHSSNPSKKIKFYIRYAEGPVVIRDIYCEDRTQNILLSRDDEEFIIYQYEDFNNTPKFWQRFYEMSNYIFEWPYICYINGKNQVMVQNCFQPKKAIIINPIIQNSKKKSFISNIFVSESYNLYIMLESENQYYIYERDLDQCIDVFLKNVEAPLFEKFNQSSLFKHKLTQMQTEHPMAIIDKDKLNRKPIYKFYVRSSTQKEVIQTNAESIILFFSDFKLYQVVNGDLQLVDTGYKFKMIDTNLLAYQTVDENNKKSNQIKLIKLNISDCAISQLYKESDHKIEEFLIQQDQLLVIIKNSQTNQQFIKVLKICKNNILQLLDQIEIHDEKLGNTLQTVELFQNNMIPSGNDVYILSKDHKEYDIKKYTNVIPIDTDSGECLLFNSPQMSFLYRKMIYFISNKSQLKPKRGIVIPYLTDNYSIFNRRETLAQFSQFYEYQNIKLCQHETDILVLIPYSQSLLRYNLKGQLIQSFKMNQIYENYGDHTLTVSPNGRMFIQCNEESQQENVISILKIQIKQDQGDNSIEQTPKDSFKNTPTRSIEANSNTFRSTFDTKKHITPKHREFLKKRILAYDSFLDVTGEERIDLNDISLQDPIYMKEGIFNMNDIVEFFKERGCEMIFKINDCLDIVVAFIQVKKKGKKTSPHNQQSIKELIVLKKIKSIRRAFRVQIESDQKPIQEIIKKEQPINKQRRMVKQISTTLLHSMPEIIKIKSNEQIFSKFNNLHNCYDFTVTNDKLILWSKQNFYHGDITKQKDLEDGEFNLTKATFQIKDKDDAYIESVTSHGATEQNLKDNNYYVYLKIVVENEYAFYIKYNIIKNKEFAAFDCKINSQVFFDSNMSGFILDEDCLVDIDQGVPLYFYKTGMRNIDSKHLIGNSIDRGVRFCEQNLHFMVRNKFYLPFSYFVFVMKQNNPGRLVDSLTFDINSYYKYNGVTILHEVSNSYQDLEFLLKKYEETNPKLKNMLLLTNDRYQNVLQVALSNENQRCVNLILHHLSDLSMNNIHQLKYSFVKLLDYSAFENYLELFFFQTDQMKNKQVFQRTQSHQQDKSFISSHDQSFLDKAFYDKFEDKNNLPKPVIIRSIDAGWLLKEKIGIDFLLKLSYSDNMNYFAIDAVRILVKYQWLRIKPMIIKFLFFPFLMNMVIYSIYSVYIFELVRLNTDQPEHKYYYLNLSFQITILLFTIFTTYVEIKQIQFHQKEYARSFWNLLDLITVVLAPLTVVMDLTFMEDYQIRPFMAICNLTFFIRFFYFLRIFDKTAHLIRTIVEITTDIFDFLFVFYLGIIGFGLSFYILSNNNEQHELVNEDEANSKFITSFANSFMYSYRMSLGDFQLDNFDSSTDNFLIWVLFVICSMTTTIILLNMLVAIMGESFSRVIEDSENQRVREHLQLIVENDFLLSNRKKFFKDVKYLIEVKDETQVINQDPLANLIETIDEKNQNRDKHIQHKMEEMKLLIKSQSEQITNLLSVKSDIQSLKKMFSEQFKKENESSKQSKEVENIKSLYEKIEEGIAQQYNLKEIQEL
eukprot:403359477